MVKKRRGRRKNVEGMDLLSFMNKSRVPAVPDQVVLCALHLHLSWFSGQV